MVLIESLIPKPILADDSDHDRPVRLYASAFAAPIGKFLALVPVSINGRRAARGEQFIWGGEMLQAPDTGVRVELDELGRVTLGGGAIVRFATARTTFDDGTRGNVLIASLINGAITLKLQGDAGAYVEAGGSVFTSSRGASFHVGVTEGRAALTTLAGTVRVEQTAQSELNIRFVDELGRPAASGAQLSVRVRAARQIQVRVTDKNDRPVPDMPVVFALAGQGGGTLGSGATAGTSLSVTTNAQGIATTSFSAGATPASTSVTAAVPGTSASTAIGVTTTAATGVITGTTLGIVAAVAGGTVATVVAVKQAQGNREPVTALPPNITPTR